MLARGGNGYARWPLKGLQAIVEKTACCAWDGEDTARAGRPGCQAFMQLVGTKTVIHDHMRLMLRCSDASCGREVTCGNVEDRKVLYTDLPARIKQTSFSSYGLKYALFLLAFGSRASVTRRMHLLSGTSCMALSTLYLYMEVVRFHVDLAFEAEMRAQRARQDAAAARYGDGDQRRRLVLSADGAWAHKGHVAKQFNYVVQDVSRDWYTIEHETEATRLERLTRRRARPPIVYLDVIDKGRQVAAHVRARPGDGTREQVRDEVKDGIEVDENAEMKEEVKEGVHAQVGSAVSVSGGVAVKGYCKEGNWASEGGSAGMEAQAFNKWMGIMKMNGLLDKVSILVVDQDLTVAATLRQGYPQIRLAADPGHVRKSLRKSFNKVFTSRKPFRYMAYRQVAWMMRTLKVAEDETATIVDDDERAEAIMVLQRDAMEQAVYHYFNVCGPECRHRSEHFGVETDSAQLLADLREVQREERGDSEEDVGRGTRSQRTKGAEGDDEEEPTDTQSGWDDVWRKHSEVEQAEGEEEADEVEVLRALSLSQRSSRSRRSSRTMEGPDSGSEHDDEDLQVAMALSRSEFESQSQSQATATEFEDSQPGPPCSVRRGKRQSGARGRGSSRGRGRGGRGTRGGGGRTSTRRPTNLR